MLTTEKLLLLNRLEALIVLSVLFRTFSSFTVFEIWSFHRNVRPYHAHNVWKTIYILHILFRGLATQVSEHARMTLCCFTACPTSPRWMWECCTCVPVLRSRVLEHVRTGALVCSQIRRPCLNSKVRMSSVAPWRDLEAANSVGTLRWSGSDSSHCVTLLRYSDEISALMM